MPESRLSKNKFFVLLFSLLYFVSFLLLFSRKGVGLYFHPDSKDSFMDLFNMTFCPFNTTYPPLSLIPFKLLYLILHPGVMSTAFDIRNNYCGAFFLMLYIFAFCSVFLFVMYFSVKGNAKRKIFYSLLFLFSGITLWTIERANIMSFAFLFSLLFVVLYSYGDERKKRLSYVFLSLAISLKLYPGAFILLLLEKKDGKGILCVALQTIVIFVFSYIVCMQLDSVIAFERNMGLFEYMKDTKSYINMMVRLASAFLSAVVACFVIYEIYKQGWKVLKLLGGVFFAAFVLAVPILYFSKGVNLLSAAYVAFEPVVNALKFGKERTPVVDTVNVSSKNFFLLMNFLLKKEDSLSCVRYIFLFQFLCVALCGLSFAFNKKTWKKLASVSLLCIYVPDFAGFYLLIYLLIPLLFFINDLDNNKIDYVYACLFAMITTFLLVPFKMQGGLYYGIITGSFIVISMYVFCLFLLLVGNAIYDMIKRKQERQ